MEKTLSKEGFKRFCVTLLALAIFFSPVLVKGVLGVTLEEITKRGVLNIGHIPVPPNIIKDPKTGELSGFLVEHIKYIAKRMKVKTNFVETHWGTFAAALQSGQIDICIAPLFRTIGRAMAVDFTVPLNYLGSTVVVKKGDTRFKKVMDLDKIGIKVSVVQGSHGHEYAREHLKNAKIVALAGRNLTAPFVEVSAGRADAAIQDNFVAYRYAKEHPEVDNLFGGAPFDLRGSAWAVPKNSQDWLNFLNVAIDILQLSGQDRKTEAKYYMKMGIPLEEIKFRLHIKKIYWETD